jgi:hypothetical protein
VPVIPVTQEAEKGGKGEREKGRTGRKEEGREKEGIPMLRISMQLFF